MYWTGVTIAGRNFHFLLMVKACVWIMLIYLILQSTRDVNNNKLWLLWWNPGNSMLKQLNFFYRFILIFEGLIILSQFWRKHCTKYKVVSKIGNHLSGVPSRDDLLVPLKLQVPQFYTCLIPIWNEMLSQRPLYAVSLKFSNDILCTGLLGMGPR